MGLLYIFLSIKVEVKRTVPREEMSTKDAPNKTRKIFVGGIPASLTEGTYKSKRCFLCASKFFELGHKY